MFTGIVKGIGTVSDVRKKEGLLTIVVDVAADVLEGVEIGASVAINGVCLTVTGIGDKKLLFDVMLQTLTVTNLCDVKAGDFINVERSFHTGAEVGGHILSGHVDGVATIARIEMPP